MKKALAVALCLCVIAPEAARALNPELAVTQYSHRAWVSDQTEGALPVNTVFSIAQTRDGYLWLATQEGLARFDGVRFVMFDSRNTPEIRHNDVWKLLEDRDGNLWLGTRGGGLVRYRDGVFANFSREQGLSSDAIMALWEDGEGALWVGTRDGGLNRYKSGRFTAYTTREGLSNDTVYSLYGNAEGLWIGTDGGGLNRFHDGKFTHLTTKQGLSNDTVYALADDGAGGFWIGTGAGLNHWSGGKLAVYRTRDGLSNDNVRAIARDRAGNVWIGTDGGGLNRLHDGRFTAITTRNGLTNDSIGAIYEDREGSLWVGTDAGGLNRLKDNTFITYSQLEGLPNDNARAVLEDRDGAIWVGTFGGLARLQGGTFRTFGKKDGLSSEVVLSLAQTRDGAIWAGTLGGGLNRLHRGRITQYGKAQGLQHDTIPCLFEDSRGTLWVGTRSGGLHRYENDRFRQLTAADGIASNDIRHIVEARDGTLWIGTLGGGVYRHRDGTFDALTKKDGLSNDLVLTIHEDAEGGIWLGTFGGGLNRYRDGRITQYTSKEGLLDDVVFRILEDEQQNLWMSSNRGVYRVSRRDLDDFAAGRIAAVSHVAYGEADGMRSHEGNGATQPAGWKARDGRLWFPTIKGIVTVDPRHLALNPVPPPVRVERVLADGKPVPAATELVLEPGRPKLEFQYTALSFLAPEKVQFRYKLDGFDEEWVRAGTRRSAHYTNIPPGQYTFRVMASNNDGVWNEAGASQVLRLKPFFWQRRAFALVYVLALALALGAGMRLQRDRVRRLQARERELLKLMSERKQAEDALRAANRALELRVIDLSRARQEAPPGPHVTVAPLPQDAGAPPEMGQLVKDFNQLLEQLSRRERDLQEARDALAQEVGEKTRANQDLEQALHHLKIAQVQLVQSEKLASLGSLVAGVAHEINTPVGIGVTAASTLHDWAQRLHDQHAGARMTRSDLDRFIAVALDSTQILLKNLQRAADLIQSFKQVAVDQASGERRRFDLRAYIDEVLTSLAPRINRSPHEVTVDCARGQVIDSYPGALAQILTNFIANSLTHAFPAGQAGHIRISVGAEGNGIVLRYSDDGVGIAPEHLGRIFDPFFTTKRGSGGSGLGMHIVYNLVTQLLGGTITVSSPPGAGAEFEVKFPAELRQAA